MTTLSFLDSSNIHLSDLLTSGKGSKTVSITDATKKSIVWQPNESFRIPFEPGAFNDPGASRQSISFSPSEEMEEQLRLLDEACITHLARDSVKYFGAEMSQDAVRERFQSSLKTSAKGYKSMKCKVNVSGKGVVQCYDADRKPMEQPSEWTAYKIRPRILVKGLWMFSRQVGVLFELAACQLEVETSGTCECPF